jgi:hypothetical protein
VKLIDISGTYKSDDLEGKINELETNSKNENVRNLYETPTNLRRITSL